MKVTLTVDKQTKQIRLKPIKPIESSSGGWDNVRRVSGGQKEMLNEIVKEIWVALNAPPTTPVLWEEEKGLDLSWQIDYTSGYQKQKKPPSL